MILTKPVCQDISLDFEELWNYYHQCANINEKSDNRQVPAKEKKSYIFCVDSENEKELPGQVEH